MLNFNLTTMKKSLISLVAALMCFTLNFAGVNENAEAVDRLPYPDLVIEGIRTEPARPRLGDEVDVLVTVANRGAVAAPVNTLVGAIRTRQEGIYRYAKMEHLQGELRPGLTETVNVGRIVISQPRYEIEAGVDHDGQISESIENNNTLTVIIETLAPEQNVPELIEYDLTLMPRDRARTSENGGLPYYRVGREEDLEVSVSVMNLNFINQPLRGAAVRISDNHGWSASGTIDIAAGDTVGTTTLHLNTRDTSTGLHELWVDIDPDNRIREVNENNNRSRSPIRVNKDDNNAEVVDRLQYPDLVIEGIRTEPARPRLGDEVDMLVTVANRGAVAAPVTTLVGAIRTRQEGIYRYARMEHLSAELGPDRTETVNVGRVIISQPRYEIEAGVDHDGQVFESIENNNTLTITVQTDAPEENVPELIEYDLTLMPRDRTRTSEDGGRPYYRVGREEDLEISVSVMNLNFIYQPLRGAAVRISDGHGWSASGAINIPDGDTVGTTTLHLNTRDTSTGVHELWVDIDPDNLIREINENNNRSRSPLRIKKMPPESDVPLPAAPRIDPVYSRDITVHGTYDQRYRNVTVDLLANGLVRVYRVPAANGVFDIPHWAGEDSFYEGQRLRVSLHATIGEGEGIPVQTAESLEITVLPWSPAPPQITGPLEHGQPEILGSYDAPLVNAQVFIEANSPDIRNTFGTIGSSPVTSGTFTIRTNAPLYRGWRIRSRVFAYKNEESVQRRDMGSWSPYSEIIVVGGEPQGTLNAVIEGLEILSDRSDTVLQEIPSGYGYRLRFTVRNTGESVIRDLAFHMEGTRISRDVAIGGRIEPGASYVYTSSADFTAGSPGEDRINVSLDPQNAIEESNEVDNSIERALRVTEAQQAAVDNAEVVDRSQHPDLVIEGIRTEPARPRLGDEVDVLVTVANRGPVSAPAGTLVGAVWTRREGAFRYARAEVLPRELGPNQTETLNVGRVVISEPRYSIEAGVDYDQRVLESNDNNNTRTITVETEAPVGNTPELLEYSVTLMPRDRARTSDPGGLPYYRVGQEEDLEIAVEIMNINLINRPLQGVAVRVGDGHGWSTSGTVNIGAGSGMTGATTLHLNTRDVSTGLHELWVDIDPDNLIREVNENNNRSRNILRVYKISQGPDHDQNNAEPIAGEQKSVKLKRISTRTTLIQVRSLSQANRSTNPFDFRDVASDVRAAQQPRNNQNPAGGQYPIALTTTFTSLLIVSPGNSAYLSIESGGSGTNTLGDFTSSPGAGTALRIQNSFNIPTLQSLVSFFAYTGWTIVSRSISNPVPFTNVTLVLKRNSDNNYFKMTTKIYGSASALDVFTLSGYNCGPNQANCP